VKFPWLPESRIESAALALLGRAFGEHLPGHAIDLDTIIYDCLSEKEGLSFDDDASFARENGDVVLGKTYPFKSKIAINRELKHPSEAGRQRFTIAHEIGHWVLHRPLYLAQRENLSLFDEERPETAEETSLVSMNRSVFGGGKTQAPEEWQANRFAVALLIDDALLRSAFSERFGPNPIAWQSGPWSQASDSLRGHARRVASQTVRSESPLHEVFGLSVEAMAIALESRGYAVERLGLL
jgi:Zn-dependent peptidase ImmA (M78 family)